VVLVDDIAIGIPTTTMGPDGIPVSGVSPVCPSARVSNPTVNRFKPAADVVMLTFLPVDDSAGKEVGRQLTPTACDTEINAGGGRAAATPTLVVELTTAAFSATVERFPLPAK